MANGGSATSEPAAPHRCSGSLGEVFRSLARSSSFHPPRSAYPIDRRPAAIAANVLLDVRKRYVRDVLEPE